MTSGVTYSRRGRLNITTIKSRLDLGSSRLPSPSSLPTAGCHKMLASSSLELCKHKREKRETATKSVCGWCQKLQGFKAQGAKNPTPLHKAKLPTASERGNVQRQFGTPQQAWSVDAHVASRKHQSLHANQTVGAVECRGENSPKKLQRQLHLRRLSPTQFACPEEAS